MEFGLSASWYARCSLRVSKTATEGFAATRRDKIKIAADNETSRDVMLNPEEKRERTTYRARGL